MHTQVGSALLLAEAVELCGLPGDERLEGLPAVEELKGVADEHHDAGDYVEGVHVLLRERQVEDRRQAREHRHQQERARLGDLLFIHIFCVWEQTAGGRRNE